MANGLLGRIAAGPNLLGNIAAGQGLVQNFRQGQMQKQALQTGQMQQGLLSQKEQLLAQEIFKGTTANELQDAGINLAVLLGLSGDNQQKTAKRFSDSLTQGSKFKTMFESAANEADSEKRNTSLIQMANMLAKTGVIEGYSTSAKKTADQIERELADKETNTALRASELKKEKEVKRSNLKVLIDEKKALAPDDPLHEQYEDAIQKEATRSGLAPDDPQIATMAAQVISGRLNPAKISKRGGLQQAVFTASEEMLPGVDLVELEANAIFKTMSGNLQSRALINGVAPLFDNLEKLGLDLHNSKFPLVNTAVNFAKEQFGEAEIVAFNNARDGIVAETERILLGSGVLSDSKYKRALQNVNAAQSAPQLKSAVAQMRLEVAKRLEALDKMPFEQKQKIIQREINNNSDKIKDTTTLSNVAIRHPQLGDITEDDIATTMRNNNMTRQQVLQKLGAQ